MKKTTLFIILVSLLAACATTKRAATQGNEKTGISNTKSSAQYNPNVLIVFFDTSIGNKPILEAAKKYGSEIIYQYNNINAVALTVPASANVNEAMTYYQNVKGVIQVNKDKIYHIE